MVDGSQTTSGCAKKEKKYNLIVPKKVEQLFHVASDFDKDWRLFYKEFKEGPMSNVIIYISKWERERERTWCSGAWMEAESYTCQEKTGRRDEEFGVSELKVVVSEQKGRCEKRNQ